MALEKEGIRMMFYRRGLKTALLFLVFLSPTGLAYSETMEMVTYYPSAPTELNFDRLHANRATFGSDYGSLGSQYIADGDVKMSSKTTSIGGLRRLVISLPPLFAENPLLRAVYDLPCGTTYPLSLLEEQFLKIKLIRLVPSRPSLTTQGRYPVIKILNLGFQLRYLGLQIDGA